MLANTREVEVATPIIPGYAFKDRGVPRIAGRCPDCDQIFRHGAPAGHLENRGLDVACYRPDCRFRNGINFLVVGKITSLRALPKFCRERAQALCNFLTESVRREH